MTLPRDQREEEDTDADDHHQDDEDIPHSRQTKGKKDAHRRHFFQHPAGSVLIALKNQEPQTSRKRQGQPDSYWH